MNDIWKVSLVEEACPLFHRRINDICEPELSCSVENSCSLECDSFPTTNSTSSIHVSECLLECHALPSSSCLIDGDMIVNSSITESIIITIVGVINVTGDVTVMGSVTLKLIPGSTIHVNKCLVLDENAQLVVVVNNAKSSNGTVLATYDSSCSSTQLDKRVVIELQSTDVDECLDGRPTVEEHKDNERAQLKLLFVPVSDCSDNSSEIDVLAISIAVSIVVLVVGGISDRTRSSTSQSESTPNGWRVLSKGSFLFSCHTVNGVLNVTLTLSKQRVQK